MENVDLAALSAELLDHRERFVAAMVRIRTILQPRIDAVVTWYEDLPPEVKDYLEDYDSKRKETALEKNLIPVSNAIAQTGYSRAWIHSLIKRGIVRGEKIGRDTFVSLADLDRYHSQANELGNKKFGVRYPKEATSCLEDEPTPSS